MRTTKARLGAGTALLVCIMVLAGCGEHKNDWRDVRYAITSEDVGGEVAQRTRLEAFRRTCPAPTETARHLLDYARQGGGVAEATGGLVDPGQEVQSFVMDLGPYSSTGSMFYPTENGDGSPEFVAAQMAKQVGYMFDEFDCSAVPTPVPRVVGDLTAREIPGGVETGVFGFDQVYVGPFVEKESREHALNPSLLVAPENVVFDEGVAPQDRRVFVEGRYTVLDGTVFVGVEVLSTHEDYVDVDELLQVMVDRVDAEPLPTHAPDDSLLDE